MNNTKALSADLNIKLPILTKQFQIYNIILYRPFLEEYLENAVWSFSRNLCVQ